MSARQNPAARGYSFHTTVGLPPYVEAEFSFRKGIKQTAFHDQIGAKAELLKLHNTYLKPYYLTDLAGEYQTMRRVAALFDVTGEEVVEIAGPDALKLIDRLVPRDMTRVPDMSAVYAIMCYDYGGIVEDAVLIRFSDQKFWWVGGLGFSEQWIYSQSLAFDVTVTGRLDRTHIASLQGPDSRRILSGVTADDITVLPFYGVAQTRIAGHPVVISRTGYTTELGYEIYIDVEHGAAVFAALNAANHAAGGTLGGSGVMDIRRVEAGLIDYSSDFDWRHTPHQLGLGWMLNRKKAFFHGREALFAPGADQPATLLAGLRLAGDIPARKGDAVTLGGRKIGEVSSGTFSPTLSQSLAISLIGRDHTAIGTALSVDIDGRAVTAEVVAMPFFGPERKLARS